MKRVAFCALLPAVLRAAALAATFAAAFAAAFAVFAGTAVVASAAAPAAAVSTAFSAEPPLSYRTSWVGNTWGFGDGRWVQSDVQALAVAPNGDLFTNAPWDEGGGEIGHYRDGALLGYGGGSHGWGMLGGDAIAVNDDYVFAAQIVVSIGNAMAAEKHLPREGMRWFGVSRRSRADVRRGVPFAGEADWPGSGLAFRVVSQAPEPKDDAIRGLAADNTRLFVSNLHDNRIDIFDAQTMQPVGGFPVPEPGRLALAKDGTLWVIERSRTDSAKRVVHHAREGTVLGTLALPRGTVPVDLAVDARGRLLVADNGVRQQVLIFAPAASGGAPTHKNNAAADSRITNQGASMQLSGTLGVAGGIYAGRAGTPGPQRFNGLTAVAADAAGNVYVAMNGTGPRGFAGGPGDTEGAVIEGYAPDGTRRFSVQGLLFVDGAQFVEGTPPSVYTGSKRFALDLSRGSGAEWSYAGFTADRFRYPYDPFLHLGQGMRGLPLVRDVRGHRLLYTTDMTSSFLRVYRFEAGSETAIPSGLFSPSHIDKPWPPNQPASGEWIWRDTAGKGRFAVTDFDQPQWGQGAPRVTAWWVDDAGNVWQGLGAAGIRRFALVGFDAVGNPVYRYSAVSVWPLPAPFTRIARVAYFPADDTLYLSGSTPAHPFLEYNWNGTGSRLARYDHWLRGKPVLRYAIDLPDRGPPDPASMNGWTVAGDYLFTVETHAGVVHVRERDTGREVGRLAPGPEVGERSGIVDVPMPVTAHRIESGPYAGEYLVFVEEDSHGKVLMYRFRPPGSSSRLPDDASRQGTVSSDSARAARAALHPGSP